MEWPFQLPFLAFFPFPAIKKARYRSGLEMGYVIAQCYGKGRLDRSSRYGTGSTSSASNNGRHNLAATASASRCS
jgi:hypothetical protein